MMIIPYLAALAAHQPVLAATQAISQAGTVERRGQWNGVQIPPALFPHLFPYSRCLAASHGRPLHSDGRPLPPLPGVTPGFDCSDYRRRAVAGGDRALRAQMPDDAQRSALISRVLEAMESSFGGPPATGESD